MALFTQECSTPTPDGTVQTGMLNSYPDGTVQTEMLNS